VIVRGAGKAGCLGKTRAVACEPSGDHPALRFQAAGPIRSVRRGAAHFIDRPTPAFISAPRRGKQTEAVTPVRNGSAHP